MENPSSIHAIQVEWDLDPSLHSKEAILVALALRVGELLAQDPMQFIQLMYRLDIPEAPLNAALESPDAGLLIAELIWNRQEQKSILRRSTPPPRSEDEDLVW
jgi:hypothetical protein